MLILSYLMLLFVTLQQKRTIPANKFDQTFIFILRYIIQEVNEIWYPGRATVSLIS